VGEGYYEFGITITNNGVRRGCQDLHHGVCTVGEVSVEMQDALHYNL